jgi:hypothetical protein
MNALLFICGLLLTVCLNGGAGSSKKGFEELRDSKKGAKQLPRHQKNIYDRRRIVPQYGGKKDTRLVVRVAKKLGFV